jgi:uncharacterized membrane-anchored protein YhcB (DUF1043 family)
MAKLLEKVRKWWRGLFRRRVATFDFERMQFDKLDVDALAEDLRLGELAAENGRNELPGSLDAEFDGPHHRIVQYIQGHCAEAIAEGEARLSGLNRAIEETDLGRVPQRLQTLLADFRARAAGLVDRANAQLPDVRQRLGRAREEVARIRERFSVERPARRYRHDMLTFGVVAGMWAMQALLNSYFFALGHEMGLVGGAAFAGLLALTDVLIATLLGMLGRHVTVDGPWRLVGAAGLAGGVAWIPGFNLLAAHFRESLQAMASAESAMVTLNDASRVALDSFASAPWGLEALDSWLLCALGLVFSTVAYTTGWQANDPIPGYGKAQRELDDVQEEWDEEVEELREELRQAAGEFREQIKDLRRHADDAIDALQSTINTKKTLLKNLSGFVDHVERSCNALISHYRDTNRRHRQTPPPEYFHEGWEYPVPAEFKDDASADLDKLARQRTLHDELGADFERAYEDLEQIAEGALRGLDGGDAAQAPGPMLRAVAGQAGGGSR